jgi:hypothetical protein
MELEVWHVTETDGDAVPGIDISKHYRQVNQFFLVELLVRLLIYFVGHMTLSDQRDRLGPCQRSPLAFVKKGRFLPDGDRMDPALIHAQFFQFLCMHIDTQYAAVDL